TKGRPARSSWSPGCSPMSISDASAGPSPNTVWVVLIEIATSAAACFDSEQLERLLGVVDPLFLEEGEISFRQSCHEDSSSGKTANAAGAFHWPELPQTIPAKPAPKTYKRNRLGLYGRAGLEPVRIRLQRYQ